MRHGLYSLCASGDEDPMWSAGKVAGDGGHEIEVVMSRG